MHLVSRLGIVAYQVGRDLFRLITPHHKRAEDDGRTLIQAVLSYRILPALAPMMCLSHRPGRGGKHSRGATETAIGLLRFPRAGRLSCEFTMRQRVASTRTAVRLFSSIERDPVRPGEGTMKRFGKEDDHE